MTDRPEYLAGRTESTIASKEIAYEQVLAVCPFIAREWRTAVVRSKVGDTYAQIFCIILFLQKNQGKRS